MAFLFRRGAAADVAADAADPIAVWCAGADDAAVDAAWASIRSRYAGASAFVGAAGAALASPDARARGRGALLLARVVEHFGAATAAEARELAAFAAARFSAAAPRQSGSPAPRFFAGGGARASAAGGGPSKSRSDFFLAFFGAGFFAAAASPSARARRGAAAFQCATPAQAFLRAAASK